MPKKEYPYLARHLVENLIVEFTSIGTGVVVSSNLPEYPRGYFSKKWMQGLFKKIKS